MQKLENNIDLEVYKGRTRKYQILFTRNNGVINIADYTVIFKVKKTRHSTETKIIKTLTEDDFEDAANGDVLIALTISDTNIDVGTYVWSVEYDDGETGDDKDFDVLFEGKFTVKKPI